MQVEDWQKFQELGYDIGLCMEIIMDGGMLGEEIFEPLSPVGGQVEEALPSVVPVVEPCKWRAQGLRQAPTPCGIKPEAEPEPFKRRPPYPGSADFWFEEHIAGKCGILGA